MEIKTQEKVIQQKSAIATIDPVIYRANDIRGVVGPDLTPDVFYTLGLSFGSRMRELHLNRCVVGRDGRLSGPILMPALIEGLKNTGVEVIEIGVVPSPALYFATHHFKTGTGIMITGSHNPPDYNGMKMMLGGSVLNQDGILALRDRIESQDFIFGKGHSVKHDILDEYMQAIVSRVKPAKKLKIVIDCGHGAAGVIALKLYEALGFEVVDIYSEVDGAFPAHHPDPSDEKNLIDLIAKVKSEKADCGLAFDGDGDRLGCVTPQGEVIRPDRQLMLYAEEVLKENPGAPIIYDVKCSKHLTRWIEQKGGQPVMYKTGHAFIKSKMVAMDAPLAGEMSGHFFFGKPWYGFDDALYTGAKLLEILSKQEASTSEVFAQLPDSVNTPELQVKMDDDRKFAFIDKLKQTSFEGADLVTIDGLRVEYPDGWGLIRASNTSPCLVLRFEADTLERLQSLKEQFRSLILKLDPNLEVPF